MLNRYVFIAFQDSNAYTFVLPVAVPYLVSLNGNSLTI